MLFACVCLMAFAPAWGETIRVAVPPLANLLERDDSGVYQRLVGRALEPLDYSIEQVFYPYRRSFKAFEQGRVDCLFSLGAILKRRLGAERIVQSYPPPEHPLLQNFDRLNCHNTERNRDFIRDLSAELKKLKEAGGYREEAGDLYMPF